MNEHEGAPPGLRIVQTRVYYDSASGDIVHVHKLAATPEDALSDQRIDEEMRAFQDSLQHRHGRSLEHLVVDEGLLEAAIDPGVTLHVDVRAQKLVRDGGG